MKFKLVIVFLITFCLFYTSVISQDVVMYPCQLITYPILKKQFTWLKKDFYKYLNKKCKQKNIDIVYALSVVQIESGGKNVISRVNRNGTRDYGYFQINSVHLSKNPRKLLNYKVNINKALWYLGLCLKKSKGDNFLACIYYNGGLNCNVKRYKSKHIAYPRRILAVYIYKTLKMIDFYCLMGVLL